MKKVLMISLLSIAGLAVVPAAVAIANNEDISAKGAAIDSYTFPDGTVVRSASLGWASGASTYILQIKNANGRECYGVAGKDGNSPSMACLPN